MEEGILEIRPRTAPAYVYGDHDRSFVIRPSWLNKGTEKLEVWLSLRCDSTVTRDKHTSGV